MNSSSRLRAFLLKQLMSPIKVALLVGVLIVLLLPPLVPPHVSKLTTWISPQNRMWAYYPKVTGGDKLGHVPFLRTSKASLTLESDIGSIGSAFGYDTEHYLERFIPLASPARDWVYFSDVDGDSITDVSYLSCEYDSTFLYFWNIDSKEVKRKVFISGLKDVQLNQTRILQRDQDEELYLSIVHKEKKASFKTSLFSYSYRTNTLTYLFEIDNIANTYLFTEYSGQLLLVNK